MIQRQHVVQKLDHIVHHGRHSEQSYRAALRMMKEGNVQELFIYLWQEHSKMVSELEDKIQSFAGTRHENKRIYPSGPFEFLVNIPREEMTLSLLECERTDALLLLEYDLVLKSPLPMDVKLLLKRHILNINGMLARVHDLSKNAIPLSLKHIESKASSHSHDCAHFLN